MNERIRLLALQAGIKYGSAVGYFYTPATDGITTQDMEKFAELIVRECCDIFVELRTRPADLAAKDVKKHFGVED